MSTRDSSPIYQGESSQLRNELLEINPRLSQACPNTIEQVSPPNQSNHTKFAVWPENRDVQEAFWNWWEQTTWRRENSEAKVVWDVSKQPSKVWVFFRAVARSHDGRPFVQCLRCNSTLSHPSLEQTGTSALRRHIVRRQCIQAAKAKSLPPISSFLGSKNVWLLQLLLHYC